MAAESTQGWMNGAKEISQYLGISVATFFREVKPGGYLHKHVVQPRKNYKAKAADLDRALREAKKTA